MLKYLTTTYKFSDGALYDFFGNIEQFYGSTQINLMFLGRF